MDTSMMPPLTVGRFPIEEGHIMMFARAIGDPNPIYRDPVYAASSAPGTIIAPPTFVEAAIHFDETWPFRPKIGERWMGSAREPKNGPNPLGDHGGTHFHASTAFEYHRLLRPGMVLHGATRPGNVWEKEGARSGRLRFYEAITEFRDESEAPVVTSTLTVVSTERKVDQPVAASEAAPERPWRRPDFPAAYPVKAPRAGDLAPGTHFSELLIDDLSRTQILLYAGASGDYSPQHTDEVYNTVIEGYPSVFAHGMLSMGMTGRMLTDWLGDGRLRQFKMNFLGQVWPGDSLTGHATVKAVGNRLVELELATVNQAGVTVLSGNATAEVDP
jgi:acyl dehydratase